MKDMDNELSPQHQIGKILLCTGILLVYMGLTAMATEPSTTRPSLPTGWAKLKLTPEQAAKVSKIKTDAANKVKELTAQIAAIKEKALEDEVAILTDTQRQMLADNAARKAGVGKR